MGKSVARQYRLPPKKNPGSALARKAIKKIYFKKDFVSLIFILNAIGRLFIFACSFHGPG